MLEEAKQFYRTSWWLIFIPGFAIYITVLSMTLTGNGVRDAIDVRLQENRPVGSCHIAILCRILIFPLLRQIFTISEVS